jgi:VanZ family protein
MKRVNRLLRFLTWAGVAAIGILSWTPGDYMIRTGIGSHTEHVTAYFLASATATLGYGRRKDPALISALYCAYAGLLEVGQLWVPGRHAGFDDFSASAIGVLLGASLVVLWSRFRSLP